MLRPLSEGELNEWEEAYAAVEAYLQALRLRNRLLVAELVRSILWRASSRRVDEPEKPARLPDQWQGVFLTPAPWPPEFVEAMKKSYLAAGPRFAALTMIPQALELNAFGSGAAQWWETMDRRPALRLMSAGVLVALTVIAVWFFLF